MSATTHNQLVSIGWTESDVEKVYHIVRSLNGFPPAHKPSLESVRECMLEFHCRCNEFSSKSLDERAKTVHDRLIYTLQITEIKERLARAEKIYNTHSGRATILDADKAEPK